MLPEVYICEEYFILVLLVKVISINLWLKMIDKVEFYLVVSEGY